jgi:hypothetical protein
MNFRNPVYISENAITCEIDHPMYGWIPFTCDPSDTGSNVDVVMLFNQMKNVAAPYTPPPGPTPEEIMAAENIAITTERNRRIDFGSSFLVEGRVDPIPITGRDADKIIYNTIRGQAKEAIDAGFPDLIFTLRDRNNVNQELTATQLFSLINQSYIWVEQVMKVSWDMKDRVGLFVNGLPEDWKDDKWWPSS